MTFDLERARGLRDFLQGDCAEVGDVWAEMVAEIERLRADLERQETFPKSTSGMAAGLHIAIRKTEEQAARIKELEDALAEYQRLGKIMYGRLPCLTLHGECDRCNYRAKEVCDAMHQIAEGKIGPDAKTRSWQITEERKEALQAMGNMKTLIVCPHCKTPIEFVDIPRCMAVLRAMLEDVEG